MKKIQFICIISLLFITFGCNKNDDDKTGGTYEIHENVVVIDEAKNQQLSAIDSSTLKYSQNIAFKIGDILVSGITTNAPYGYLRKVVSTDWNGQELTVVTQDAYLTDVIKNGKAQFKYTITPDDTLRSSLFTGNFQLNAIPEITNTSGIEANLNGNYSIGLDFIVDFQIDDSQLTYAKFGIETTMHGAINAEITGLVQLPQDSFEAKLFEYPITPITFWAGAVPIVFYPDWYGKIGVAGSAGGYVKCSSDFHAVNEYFAQYENSTWDFMKANTHSSSFQNISAGVAVNAEAYLKIGLKAKLYDSDDNYGKVEGKLAIKAGVDCSQNTSGCSVCDYTLKAGAKGKAEIALGLFEYNVASFTTSTPELIIANLASGTLPKGCVHDYFEFNSDFGYGVAQVGNVFYGIGNIQGVSATEALIKITSGEVGSAPSIISEKTIEYNWQNGGFVPRVFGSPNKLFLVYEKQGTLIVEEYNLTTSSWSQKGNLPSGIGDVYTQASWNDNSGNVYLPCSGGGGNKLYKYTVSNDTWQSITSLPINPSDGIRLVGENPSKLYISSNTDVYEFDKSTSSFMHVPNSNVTQIDPNLANFEHIGMAKGEIIHCSEDAVYKYNMQLFKWEFCFANTATYPNSFQGIDTKSVNDKMYLIFSDWQLVTVLELEIF